MKKKNLTARAVVERIKSGDVSCEDLVCRIYERIERSELNAFITLNKENAVEKAREADKRKNEDEYRRKKLLGVPVAIKDSISTMGIQTTCASKILRVCHSMCNIFIWKKFLLISSFFFYRDTIRRWGRGKGERVKRKRKKQ